MPQVSATKIRELQSLPYGKAGQWIRKNIDPMWGLVTGETKEFVVHMRGHLCKKEDFDGSVTVSANDKDMAEKLAYAVLDQNDPQKIFKWEAGNPMLEDWDDEEWNILSVKEA